MKRFRIRNWKKYQPRGGRLTWFRVDIALFRDPEVMVMPTSLRFQYIAILGLAAEQGNSIPADPVYLSAALSIPESEINLEALYLAKLIEDDDGTAQPKLELDDDPPESRGIAQEVGDYWNEKVDAPKLRGRLSDARVSSVCARLKDYSVEDVREAIDKRAASTFLSEGATNAPVAFDFVFGPRNFPKVLEGNYDDKQKKGTKTRTPTEASGSDFFYADRCCKMRGLDAEEMTQAERIDILNEDLAVIVKAARAEDKDIRGSIADLFSWYAEKFGGHPGKEGTI